LPERKLPTRKCEHKEKQTHPSKLQQKDHHKGLEAKLPFA